MGERIGLIAGAGEFPLLALGEAKRRGLHCVAAAIRGETSREIADRSDDFMLLQPGEAVRALAFFKKHQVNRVLMVGKIPPQFLFQEQAMDQTTRQALAGLPDRSVSTVIRRAIAFFEEQGIAVLDPMPFLKGALCPEGVMAGSEPPPHVLDDVAFGWPLARTIADQDIGQTVVVKGRSVVAVEGLEGTDGVIRRAAELAGPGVVVLKVARTNQDPRVDIPAVGPETVRSLIKAEAAALCIEAQAVLFSQREKAVALARSGGVILMATKG